jgi:uncharacterized protein (DUF58 family)
MNGDRLMKLVTPYGYRHPLLVARVRIGVDVWLLILTAVLYGHGQGGWWGVLLVAAAALHFYLAYRVPRAIGARTNSRDA